MRIGAEAGAAEELEYALKSRRSSRSWDLGSRGGGQGLYPHVCLSRSVVLIVRCIGEQNYGLDCVVMVGIDMILDQAKYAYENMVRMKC